LLPAVIWVRSLAVIKPTGKACDKAGAGKGRAVKDHTLHSSTAACAIAETMYGFRMLPTAAVRLLAQLP
jgi:hypothetical protein